MWTSYWADEEQTANTTSLFSTCFHVSGDHTVTVQYKSVQISDYKSEIHRGLDDVLPMNVKRKWKSPSSIQRQVCFQEKGTRAQKQRTRKLSRWCHILMINSGEHFLRLCEQATFTTFLLGFWFSVLTSFPKLLLANKGGARRSPKGSKNDAVMSPNTNPTRVRV